MACFSDYILVRGHCGSAVPSTDLYINDLEGVTLADAAQVADSEVVTGVALLNRCIDWGIRQAKHDIISKMGDIVSFDSIQHSQNYGYFTPTYLPLTAGERGLKVTIDDCCRLTGIFVKEITVRANTTITGKVLKIIDGVTETSYTVNLTAGLSTTIRPNYKANEKEITIVWDGADVAANDSTVQDTSTGTSFSACGDFNCTQDGCGRNGITVVGTDDSSNSFGISSLIQVRCDEEQFVCEIEDKMDYMVLYAAGLQFIREKKVAQRINAFVIYTKEEYEWLYGEWQKKYDEEISSLIKTLPTWMADVAPCCVKCDSSRWTYAHP